MEASIIIYQQFIPCDYSLYESLSVIIILDLALNSVDKMWELWLGTNCYGRDFVSFEVSRKEKTG